MVEKVHSSKAYQTLILIYSLVGIIMAHTERNIGANKKNLLFVAMSGGLGNQLFQLAAALSRAPIEDIYLDYGISNTQPGVLSEYAFPRELRIYNKKVPLIFRKAHNLFMLQTRFTPNGLKAKISRCVSSAILFFYRIKLISEINAAKQIRINRPPRLLIGYFHDENIAQSLIHTLGNLRSQAHSNEFDEYAKSISTSKPLIVHLRLGDYSMEPEIGMLTSEYFALAISFLRQRGISNPILVFTNDIPRAELIISNIQQVHEYQFAPGNLSPSETLELMTHGSAFIISNSTFSWWAAFMRKDRNALVIAPKPWYRTLSEPEKMIPDDWVRLSSVFGSDEESHAIRN
jgi:hypothetical protein